MEATLNYVPANKDILLLKLDPFQVFELDKVLDGTIDPVKYTSVRLWREQFGDSSQGKWKSKLIAANEIMQESGVEVLAEDGKAIASYVNTGETYTPTVLYDHEKQEFLITSWGDFLEEWTAENFIEIDCEELAERIHNLSHDPSIPWEECVEADRLEYDSDEDFLEDAYIDIRLQVMDDHQWYFHSGDSSYDTDHRGAWGSSSVGKCVSMKKAMEIAKNLIEQAAESADCNLTKQVRAYNDGN